MKRIISLTLGALMLATATGGAAMARPGHGGGGHGGWNGDGWHGGRGHGWHDNGGVLAAGLGLFALGAIIASDRDRDDRYDDRYAPPPPPPPPYGDRGYDERYGYDDYDR